MCIIPHLRMLPIMVCIRDISISPLIWSFLLDQLLIFDCLARPLRQSSTGIAPSDPLVRSQLILLSRTSRSHRLLRLTCANARWRNWRITRFHRRPLSIMHHHYLLPTLFQPESVHSPLTYCFCRSSGVAYFCYHSYLIRSFGSYYPPLFQSHCWCVIFHPTHPSLRYRRVNLGIVDPLPEILSFFILYSLWCCLAYFIKADWFDSGHIHRWPETMLAIRLTSTYTHTRLQPHFSNHQRPSTIYMIPPRSERYFHLSSQFRLTHRAPRIIW